MANMTRLLGTMLATGMAGRSRRGSSFAAGPAAALAGGGLGRGLKGKAGIAALGYLAYRAYQDHQANTQRRTQQQPAGGHQQQPAGGHQQQGQGGGGLMGALGGLLGGGGGGGTASGGGPSLSDRLAGVLNPKGSQRAAQPAPEETLDERRAMLLIRAMIAAANADGTINPEERQRILAKLDEAGADAEERRIVEREIENPVPLDSLLRDVNDAETAEQFYLASEMAIQSGSPTEKSYLQYLASRLNLDAEQVEELNRMG